MAAEKNESLSRRRTKQTSTLEHLVYEVASAGEAVAAQLGCHLVTWGGPAVTERDLLNQLFVSEDMLIFPSYAATVRHSVVPFADGAVWLSRSANLFQQEVWVFPRRSFV